MRRRRTVAAAGIAVVVAALLASCAAFPDSQDGASGVPAATSTPKVEQDISYPTGDGSDQLLDACIPKGGTKLPVVVLIHGGSFVTGNRHDLDSICAAAAARGFAAFSIDYRLVPYVTYPVALQDLASAVNWLTSAAQVQRFGLDPDRVSLVGASAGATLAAQLATGVPQAPKLSHPLRSVVLLSGAYRFTADSLTPDLLKAMTDYLGCSSVADCPLATQVAPENTVHRGEPPMLIVNSENELMPKVQATGFAAAVSAAGASRTLRIVAGQNHADEIVLHDPATADAMWAYLAKTLAAG